MQYVVLCILFIYLCLPVLPITAEEVSREVHETDMSIMDCATYVLDNIRINKLHKSVKGTDVTFTELHNEKVDVKVSPSLTGVSAKVTVKF